MTLASALLLFAFGAAVGGAFAWEWGWRARGRASRLTGDAADSPSFLRGQRVQARRAGGAQ